MHINIYVHLETVALTCALAVSTVSNKKRNRKSVQVWPGPAGGEKKSKMNVAGQPAGKRKRRLGWPAGRPAGEKNKRNTKEKTKKREVRLIGRPAGEKKRKTKEKTKKREVGLAGWPAGRPAG